MELDIVAAGSAEKEKRQDHSRGREHDEDEGGCPRQTCVRKGLLYARLNCAGCRDVNDDTASK